ncbi:MAG: aminotransferase class I/II-fold pyridoxal phosphate-dependent enzyme [Cyclobacteriaceae bacterium]
MTQRIYLSPPHMCGEEQKFIARAFESNWIAPVGPAITEFENQLAEFNAVDHCLAVNSGTAAIHLALIALGVDKNDEVICSTFTFSGSCNPIIYQSAVPVFVDSEMRSWNMDPELLEQAIKERTRLGKKPKAIIVVHLFGMPADMDRIMPIARHYDVPVIEDAAEALGSTLNGKKLGTIGDIGVYSFNGNKIITTSGGGALVSSNKELIDRARFLSSQSRTPAPYYQHEEIGYNYQLSNICASIGLGQMTIINDRIKARRANFDFYKKNLNQELFSFQPEPINAFSNRWLSTIVIEKNWERHVGEIMAQLGTKNIEARRLWKPMHLQPVFKKSPNFVNGVSEALFEKGLCLPSGSSLSNQDIGFIVDEIKATRI